MNVCRILSYFFFAFYMFIVFLNYRVILGIDSKGTWQNYEGLVFYTLLCFQATSMYEYCKNKVIDCEKYVKRL